jgi:hypothetical protein
MRDVIIIVAIYAICFGVGYWRSVRNDPTDQ